MNILNRSKPLPSTASMKDLVEAIQSVDLSSIPPHQRKQALQARVLRVASMHLLDRNLGNKIASAYIKTLSS